MADFAKFDGADLHLPDPSPSSGIASPAPSSEVLNQKQGSKIIEDEVAALTEPVCTTIWKDLKRICIKLRYVLFPFGTSKIHARNELRNWDLWGPLIFCLILSLQVIISDASLLNAISSSEDSGLIFELTFIVVWCGAAIVAINGKLLGGKISFFQAVCTLGYCVFPIVMAAALILILKTVTTALWVKLLIVFFGFSWSTFASSGFISEMMPPERRALGLYPIFLFYLFLAWFTLT